MEEVGETVCSQYDTPIIDPGGVINPTPSPAPDPSPTPDPYQGITDCDFAEDRLDNFSDYLDSGDSGTYNGVFYTYDDDFHRFEGYFDNNC